MTAAQPALAIRRYDAADMDALFDICLKTADSGTDATALYSDPKLPGYIWAAPYGALEPGFAFILAAGEKRLGYVVAAPDSDAFMRRLETEWWPGVRHAVAGLVAERPLDRNALRLIATPEGLHSLPDYPAHLHINLLPDAQSGGWGRRLIDAELAALRAAGIRGVHLGVGPANERAKGFYRHIGFEDISRDGHVIFGMKLVP